MPEVIILAGPNGAGKTTFANEYLAFEERLTFVNADEIALDGSMLGLSGPKRDIRAARLMLQRMDSLVAARADFMFETTLASLTYARRIPIWRSLGYHVALLYLRLPSADRSVERVRRRVEAGGHGVAEGTIRRRFAKSLVYLDKIYKPLVDEWYIWDSLEGDFRIAESSWNR